MRCRQLVSDGRDYVNNIFGDVRVRFGECDG